ncbi:MAG: RagB/SusD family nutrient uptake outer membrane protein, partial [Bacteroidales bacterium]|nr:RagB/SusD family nutrient uptake outer membrane protein [Bacteroidales bacterium]
MKPLKYIIIILLGSQLCLSCTDYLDKELDTELTLSMVFEDKVRMEGWLANVYVGIPQPTWNYLRNEGWDVLGDEITPSERWREFGWNMIPCILGEWTPMTHWDANYWEYLPQHIRTAYIFMENVKPLPDQDVSAQEVEYMKAECRFLAAYYYYLMVNAYGAIPFQPGRIVPTSATAADLKIGQTPYDEVIDWLDKELVAVSKILPAKYTEANKYGRATSIMCLAVRARMLLFAASDLVNGNPDYIGYVNNEGKPIFNPVKDDKKWEKAATACKELITAADATGHELYIERNNDGSIDPFKSLQNLFLNESAKGNSEILFARPSEANRAYDRHAAPKGDNGNGGLGVTQRLVDAFFMKNGLP